MKATLGHLVWHDQFKTAVLACRAGVRRRWAQAATFGLVAADTTPITNDNTDYHTKITNLNSTSAIATQAVADKNTSRANANKHACRAGVRRRRARALARRGGTGANRGNGEGILCSLRSLLFKSGSRGVVQLDFDKSISDGVNIYAKRDGDVSVAAPTRRAEVRRRRMLVATKPELREYKAVYVQSDAEIGLFSDEVVVNCAP